MIGGQPIFVLREGTKRESGRDAMQENIDAAKAIATILPVLSIFCIIGFGL